MPTVSIIMGIYNCEETLALSIESILDQTYTDWELILCDDSSTDNTFKIAQQFANQHNNILLMKNEKNMGLAFSLNRCLDNTKGRYIARTDADDICLPNRLQIQVEFLNAHDEYQVVGSSVILYDDTGDKAIRIMSEMPSTYDLIKGVPFVHPTIMMRKKTYDSLNGYTVSARTRRSEDADLWYRFYASGFKGYNIQKPLLKYHESMDDYKKRNLKVRIMGVKTRYIGYKTLKIPIRYYVFIFKPLLSALIPRKMMYFYHKSLKEEQNG